MKNHRTITSIILLICFFATLKSQTHYESNISVGVKGGVSLSQTFFNPNVPQTLKLGGVGGVTFRYIEEKYFGLVAELNFEQRGWKENFEDAPYSYSRTINYLQLPVLAHIYFGSDKARFFANLGPEIGLFIGESTKANFDINDYQTLPNFPIRNRNNTQFVLPVEQTIDYGISAGLGAEIFVNKRNSLTLEGRFYYGLGNQLKSGRTEPFNASNSMSIMVTLGYWFRVK